MDYTSILVNQEILYTISGNSVITSDSDYPKTIRNLIGTIVSVLVIASAHNVFHLITNCLFIAKYVSAKQYYEELRGPVGNHVVNNSNPIRRDLIEY